VNGRCRYRANGCPHGTGIHPAAPKNRPTGLHDVLAVYNGRISMPDSFTTVLGAIFGLSSFHLLPDVCPNVVGDVVQLRPRGEDTLDPSARRAALSRVGQVAADDPELVAEPRLFEQRLQLLADRQVRAGPSRRARSRPRLPPADARDRLRGLAQAGVDHLESRRPSGRAPPPWRRRRGQSRPGLATTTLILRPVLTTKAPSHDEFQDLRSCPRRSA